MSFRDYVLIERDAKIEVWESCDSGCQVFHKLMATCVGDVEAERVISGLQAVNRMEEEMDFTGTDESEAVEIDPETGSMSPEDSEVLAQALLDDPDIGNASEDADE